MDDLSFEYRAALVGTKTIFTGSVHVDGADRLVVATPRNAAWSFVRRLLKVAGQWHCMVLMGDAPPDAPEWRRIDVTCDGCGVTRTDHPMEPPAACH